MLGVAASHPPITRGILGPQVDIEVTRWPMCPASEVRRRIDRPRSLGCLRR